MDKENDLRAAEEAGFDLSLLDHSLSLTPEQRLKEHQGALDLVWKLEEIRDARNEESQ